MWSIYNPLNILDRGFWVSAKDQLFTDKKQSLLGSDKNSMKNKFFELLIPFLFQHCVNFRKLTIYLLFSLK